MQKMQEEAEDVPRIPADSSDEDSEVEGIMTRLQSTVEAVQVRTVCRAQHSTAQRVAVKQSADDSHTCQSHICCICRRPLIG